MGWGFVWLMVVLKIPIVALLTIVWWAVRAEPEPSEDQGNGGDGGSKHPRHPRKPFPRRPRRGPHGDPAVAAPPRVRSVVARSKRLGAA